jgi:hypothetical protein
VFFSLNAPWGASINHINKVDIIKKHYTRIAWAFVEEVPMLMGRMDIFDKFRIIFDEKKGWIDFEE